jgi:hypothetical protein
MHGREREGWGNTDLERQRREMRDRRIRNRLEVKYRRGSRERSGSRDRLEHWKKDRQKKQILG